MLDERKSAEEKNTVECPCVPVMRFLNNEMHLDPQANNNGRSVGARETRRNESVDAVAEESPIANADTDVRNKPIPLLFQ